MAGPNSTRKRGPLLNHLDAIEEACVQGNINLQKIFDIFGAEGHYVLILFLILPFLQPIPLLGLSTPFGIIIAMVAIFAYLKKPPRIPKQWGQKNLPSNTVLKIAEGSERIFEKLSFFLHPRLKQLFRNPFRFINMAVIVINAILLALPLPVPFSNTVPAWAILFVTLANPEKDGLFIILSYVQSVLCLLYFALLVEGVGTGLEFLKTKFIS